MLNVTEPRTPDKPHANVARKLRLKRRATCACIGGRPREGIIADATKWRLGPLLLLAAAPLAAATPKPGDLAPDFTLTLFDRSKVSLADLRGKVVVLNFWATWCGPCKRELPLLDAYYRLRKDYGLVMYAVATEDSVPPAALKPLADKLTFPLARALRGPYRVLEGVPTNYVIGRDGRVRYAKAGAFDLDALNGVLTPLLSEPVPPETPQAAAGGDAFNRAAP